MISKAIGGGLLLVGTSIGAGMLALPLVLAKVGFLYSLILLCLCWLIMYLGARYILEVNASFAPGSHLVSMAKARLGLPGQILAWISCLCLLYSLLAGYIAGGSDVSKNILHNFGVNLSDNFCTIGFTLTLGLIVYAGIKVVDYVNRVLMFGKLGIFIVVSLLLFPSIKTPNLAFGSFAEVSSCLMILITSFGFASIVPSLYYYFNNEVNTLRKVLFWGSLVPLVAYVVWLLVMMGALPKNGVHSLGAISLSTHPLGGLINSLQQELGIGFIEKFFTLFTVICLLTAFLGVALGLFDFLKDGCKLQKSGIQGLVLFSLTFFPPMLVVLFNPGIYIHALSYAGRCCVLLLLILPSLMLLRSPQKTYSRVVGGRVGAALVFVIAVILLFM
ncbi:MAG: tryptophan/tyrosine permease [Legionellales bacterium RIFCSPHIGHO2_12_FULL_37_14]|nr:MAG: tryptophan/tyrosine permease [Legionellales bacterium RIFCSPHIGHO2_12_FULL_37_14]